MAKSAIENILEEYLNWEIVKNKRGYYSERLRLSYDNDAQSYLKRGYSEKEALYADTVISPWTIYKRLLLLEAGWTAYRTEASLRRLLYQIRTARKNYYTPKIIALNNKIEFFAKIAYTEGNYMLLPDRHMNKKRYEIAEDRIDMTLYHSFKGGQLNCFFKNENELRQWVETEHFLPLFDNNNVDKKSIKFFVNNPKKISEMDKAEVWRYVEYAAKLIEYRNKVILIGATE